MFNYFLFSVVRVYFIEKFKIKKTNASTRKHMKIGVSSWCFAWSIGVPNYPKPEKPLDFNGLLQRAKELDVELLQIAENFPLHEFKDSTLEEWASLAREYDLDIEPATWGISPEVLLKYLDIAEIFRSNIVRTIVKPEEARKGLPYIIQNLWSALPKFEERKVTLLLENYEQTKSDELLKIFTTLNSSYIGLCLDTTNSIGAVEPVETIMDKLISYVKEVHLKDYIIRRFNHRFGMIVIGAPLGEGQLDIDSVLKRIFSIQRDINIILEQWLPFTRSLEETLQLEAEWLAKSVAFLRNMLKRMGGQRTTK